jgi:hypothetical protein
MGQEELKKEGFVKKCVEMERAGFTFARRIHRAIDQFCEVRSWYVIFKSPQIEIFGLASDVELAAYLIESLTSFSLAGADLHIAIERKMAIAVASPMTAAQSREAYRSYLVGCATRISVRLRELAQQRQKQGARPGSYGALITLDKDKLIGAEMERVGIRLQSGSSLTGAANGGSFAAGTAHGGKASFGRPIAGGHIAGMIGKST